MLSCQLMGVAVLLENGIYYGGHVSELRRDLQSRHLSMIAIGGAIGTGLFVATGASLSSAGPGGAIAAYLAIGLMVYFLMTSLGEMATYMPVSGSFETYVTRFVDPSLGFALGWNYWYNWAITVAVELAAAALVMKFWFPHSSPLLWSAILLSLLFGCNYLSARAYGETEYWFAGIKVAMVILFLIVGGLLITGLLGDAPIGVKNFTVGEAPFVGGLGATLGIFMVAGFSFQGTELVGIAAGESENPTENVPKAINSVFWRILIFYVLSIAVIGLVIPYNDPNLLNSSVENIAISPFTLIFERAGLTFSATLVNLVVLVAVVSCGNSGMYASTRMLYAMAIDGKAPKVFAKVNNRGVPVNALYITTFVGMAAFLTSLFGDGAVYNWLLNASGLAGFIAWLGIAIGHYRFRKAYIRQGKKLEDLKYRAKFFPFGPLFAFSLCLFVILGQNYQAFAGEIIDWKGLLISYIGLPIFILIWFVHKWIHKTKIIPLEECQLDYEEN